MWFKYYNMIDDYVIFLVDFGQDTQNDHNAKARYGIW